jgi:predicted amidophosphoribosyltransferase
VETRILKRVKNTVPLKLLGDAERKENLKKAFNIGVSSVKLKQVILVDDIYTTGSTLDACAKVLLDAGVQRVYCVCVAIGSLEERL